MYVKSLTLKGFKSFASATHLRLEPGITCIVGPNGSGKSNVADALAWVMGEQGAKTLRGGKMEDVIFAGTAGRAPLGRAEVTLTIDNTDAALPIDYTEVTISRTMFRGGNSEYAINGTNCRLLDVQELLSDSGIGREMHVIVGQGQLDEVLRASPEERRAFIEEAAGILKHRKRKEKALRKLEAMEANLARLADLTTEIGRQLRPLGRQAEAARRAAIIQADARDSRLRLLADDLTQLTATVEREVADEAALLQRRASLEERLQEAQDRLQALRTASHDHATRSVERTALHTRLATLVDRLESTARQARDRVRLLASDSEHETTTGRDPAELLLQAAQARSEEQALQAEIDEISQGLQSVTEQVTAAQERVAAEQRRVTQAAQAAADRREGLARLAGQVTAADTRIEAGQAEIARLEALIAECDQRANDAHREHAALESRIAADESAEGDLDTRHEAATAALAVAQRQAEAATSEERAAEQQQAAAAARVDALALSLTRQDGAENLLAAAAQLGIKGRLAELIQVSEGDQVALAAALGPLADALVVDDDAAAQAAFESLREQDAGKTALLVANDHRLTRVLPELPSGARWASSAVQAPAELAGALAQVLHGVALVTDAAAAGRVVRAGAAAGHALTAVTADGDLYGLGQARGGSSNAPSLIEAQAAYEQAQRQVQAATVRVEQANFALQAATAAVAQRQTVFDATLAELNASDARLAAVADHLSALGAASAGARAEAQRHTAALRELAERVTTAQAELAQVQQRQARASAAPETTEEPPDVLANLELAASRARTQEMDIRLSLRTLEERARALQGRAESLEGAARNEQQARERLAQRRQRREAEASTAAAVQQAAQWAATSLSPDVVTAAQHVEQSQTRSAELAKETDALREQTQLWQDELRALTDTVHRDEVARAAQLARIEQLKQRALDELGIDPQTLLAQFGPEQPVPQQDDNPPVPYERAAQEKRLRAAERGLQELGKVNPLALEEFAALEERHVFLSTQLEDLRSSKKDLLHIVSEVDQRVEEVFAAAFADTAREFEGVFSRLFPGGVGKLVLTDPRDLLNTGFEVEARPPGKKVKRLSLLSGGERSLVAMALLVAIFKARPSPFYILDEVEAALDDTNLARLHTLLDELRSTSQLIVITHQKSTMEIADALYGVSMRGDGITTVISQRLREVEA